MTLREQLTNGARTTLAAQMDADHTTCTVTSELLFPASGQWRIRVDNEVVIASHQGTARVWTLQRAQEGTTATSHSAGAELKQILTAGAITGLLSVYDRGAIDLHLDGNGSPLATGVRRRAIVPYDLTLDEVIVDANAVGTLTLDLWAVAQASYPPGTLNSLSAGAGISLSGVDHLTNGSLTGWTRALTRGQALWVNVGTCAGISEAVVHLGGSRA